MRNEFFRISIALLFVFSIQAVIIGQNGPNYTFDVQHYDIQVKVQPAQKRISGTNTITFKALGNTRSIQLDFVKEMMVEGVFDGFDMPVSFTRKGDDINIEFKDSIKTGETGIVRVKFSGNPLVAKKAPWDGGFVWSKDKTGNDWVGLACESKGASIWLPCKDEWSDEPESMDMHLSVPVGLTGVSNGVLVDVKEQDSFSTFHWRVSNPINHYNISINVGKYAHIKDVYRNIDDIDLNYYVLEYNQEKARNHFLEVDTMLRAFEHYFGPYPFPVDGYKLVETPYWGMEHQSCVAYGNNYKYNKYGFDFIIVHESGHEWFANSITAIDPADMWIHESFTTYSEALFLEYTKGRQVSLDYLNMQREKIVAKRPMQGKRYINYHNHKDNDIYYKGTWMLQTLREHIGNDSQWFKMIRSLDMKFRHSIISTETMLTHIDSTLKNGSMAILSHYIYKPALPCLKLKIKHSKDGKTTLEYRFKNTEPDFALNLSISIKGKRLQFKADSTKRSIEIPSDISLEDLKELEKRYLVEI